jgi:hypothetical protein
MTEQKRRAPRNLGRPGKAFWRQVTDDYELSPAEEAVLVEACRTLDMIDRLEEEAAGQPLTEISPQGRVVNPLIRECRMQKAILDRLVRSLGIPLVDGTSRGSRPGRGEYPQERQSFRIVEDAS